MRERITIDPITRLEGHGRIEIFLDDEGNVEKAFFQVPELRGFEKFSLGRPAEDMPQITARICGVCPTAHHMASSKALDDLFKVDPPPTARKIRELIYHVFMLEDHALHFYFLGGPDFVVGPKAPREERNILGVIAKVGVEIGKRVIATRRELRGILTLLGGKAIHPVCGLPGGVSKGLTKKEDLEKVRKVAGTALDFSLFTLKLFEDLVLKSKEYVDLILSPGYTHRTYYMGLVDGKNHPDFYDGMIRVVDPLGKEFAKFRAQDYLDYVAEHLEPWSYTKFMFLKKVGWKGFVEGPDSGIYAVAPLARLNVAEGMSTLRAQEACERFYETLGGKPVHHTLAMHWARVIEMVNAAERIEILANDSDIASPDIRNMDLKTPEEGFGVVEAPRGTLFHHYKTDDRGIITQANLIVATQNNSARIAMSVEKATRTLIKNSGDIDEGILTMVEMAFRAYDPCHACATHTLPGGMPLLVTLRNSLGEVIRSFRRDRR